MSDKLDMHSDQIAAILQNMFYEANGHNPVYDKGSWKCECLQDTQDSLLLTHFQHTETNVTFIFTGQ